MLHIHRAERADGLVAALGALLGAAPADPLAAEVVAVPTRGMERWLAQRLSARLGATPGRGDGVCANIMFPSPHRLSVNAVAAASGVTPDQDPWLPERAVWPLLEVVERSLGEPWLHELALHLGEDSEPPDPIRRSRRLTRVRHLMQLFDRYALHRPEMILAWEHARNGTSPAEESSWQAELWRRLRERIGQPGPAERLEGACARLREDPALVELPERVSLFGLTRLPAGHLRVLRAIAATRDVHLFLLHPSPALWEQLASDISSRSPIIRRSDDVTASAPVNPLLASWGQDAREMQLVLAAGADHADHHHPVEQQTGTLLSRIQHDVRGDHRPSGPPLPDQPDARAELDPGDRSMQIHSCHGRARQVEVVRDVILQLLKDDPTLEPRDVIVMCPDIETFAPLIHATFGAGEPADGDDVDPLPADLRPPDLRVRLADRALRQTNPVLGVVAQLLDLIDGRLTASQVLDLADREPVRRRFRLDDDDLSRLQDWVSESGIRWGLDGPHRAPFRLQRLSSGTWRAGLDRILLGVTMTEDEQRLFGGVLALDDVDNATIDLAGRLAELIDRLHAAIDALSTPHNIDAWAAAIAAAADELTATSAREDWQRNELQRLLEDIVAEATAADTINATPVTPTELRGLLADRLQGRPTRANFRTGHLTICTLVPMRSVPHRVVCLLGLDDGVFPRKAPRDGDDLTLDDPNVGERDPRLEDRQLLLDALLAATDTLIVTYTGNDERTNAPRPPAVPVGELLDVIDATDHAGERTARAQVVIRHPLQPFDPRNFTQGALVRERPWSFDAVTLEGARALTQPRDQPPPFLTGPLTPVDATVVEVEDLVRFVQHPVRAFLRGRLGISVRDFSDEVEDDLDVELDALGRWGVGQRLLDARLAGIEGRAAILAEIARGTLPPGVLGQPVIDEVFPIVEEIVADAEALVHATAQAASIDVRVDLAGGQSLSGTVPGVHGELLRTVTYSRLAAKHRLTSWVRLLALTAAHPDRPFEAATIGRAGGSACVSVARIAPLGGDEQTRRSAAIAHLQALVDLYLRGMREPLPLYCATSAAYAQAIAVGADAVEAASDAWTSDWKVAREDKELEHQLVLGGVRSFDDLLDEPPGPDEHGDGWATEETSRLGRYARRMWDGLLCCEALSQR